jgi:hypothetical protein
MKLSCRPLKRTRSVPPNGLGIENQLPLLRIEDHLPMAPRTGTAPYQLSIERWHCRQSVEKPMALWLGAVVLRNAVK